MLTCLFFKAKKGEILWILSNSLQITVSSRHEILLYPLPSAHFHFVFFYFLLCVYVAHGGKCQCIHPSLFPDWHLQPGVNLSVRRIQSSLSRPTEEKNCVCLKIRKEQLVGASAPMWSQLKWDRLSLRIPDSLWGAQRIARWAVSRESPQARAGLLSQQFLRLNATTEPYCRKYTVSKGDCPSP